MEKSSPPLAVIFSIVVIGAAVLFVGRGITSESNRARQLEAQAVIAQAAEAQARAQLKALEPLALAAKTDTALTVGYAISDRLIIAGLLLLLGARSVFALLRTPVAPVAPAPAPREEFEDGSQL